MVKKIKLLQIVIMFTAASLCTWRTTQAAEIILDGCLRKQQNTCKFHVIGLEAKNLQKAVNDKPIILTYNRKTVYVAKYFKVFPAENGVYLLAKGKWHVDKAERKAFLQKPIKFGLRFSKSQNVYNVNNVERQHVIGRI